MIVPPSLAVLLMMAAVDGGAMAGTNKMNGGERERERLVGGWKGRELFKRHLGLAFSQQKHVKSGAVACDVEMFSETKLREEAEPKAKVTTSQAVDREYVEYNSPKMVFIVEACDDLGG
ncbi:Light regulated Lir1 [Cynara cardunculus var. scolymus]|uniref:Light regulated Lir1 n=1 Tax=Cynara cardunculus var. scolymus TaxID=59895 RepID=A0A118JSW2_CYNCS|nr:Light regulated Lir1 [Cynara cardunculus var. scolymus]